MRFTRSAGGVDWEDFHGEGSGQRKAQCFEEFRSVSEGFNHLAASPRAHRQQNKGTKCDLRACYRDDSRRPANLENQFFDTKTAIAFSVANLGDRLARRRAASEVFSVELGNNSSPKTCEP